MRKFSRMLKGALIGNRCSFLMPCVSRQMSQTNAAIDPKRGRGRECWRRAHKSLIQCSICS